ncbi:MAG: hypothetical protein Q8J68_05550 [Methanolobus sp.]|uniref:hypothetical protein n=1 Tax=Methanolobus sp. TaxID=1874737 RepID=UPI002730E6C6|nr:hypothetical protein [Methanolobus sp.]MDP2216735.1 hypothetical protein [Methanolobus sp.]
MTGLDNYPLSSIRVSKSISDAFWQLEASMPDVDIPTNYTDVPVQLEDNDGVDRTVFYGITAPDEAYKLKNVDTVVRIFAYDYGWFLSRQFVPEELLILPADESVNWYIEELLGGVNWQTVTGIEPYKVNTPPPAIPKKEFSFKPDETKLDAINDIAEYYNCVFEVKWHNAGTSQSPVWISRAYFVRSNQIDSATDGLDLPEPVVLERADDDTIDITVVNSSEDKYNRIYAIGCNSAGQWFKGIEESQNVTSGTAKAREYMEYPSPYVSSQQSADERAQELYSLFNFPIKRITANLTQRHDLQLYQLAKFDGWTEYENALYTVGMTGENWVRIVEITHIRNEHGSSVNIVCVPDRDLSQSRLRSYSVSPNVVDDTEAVVYDVLTSMPSSEIGVAAAPIVGSSTTTVELNRGGTITARVLGQGESIVLPVDNDRVIISGGGGGWTSPAESDLDMQNFKVKSTSGALRFEVYGSNKIIFSRGEPPE